LFSSRVVHVLNGAVELVAAADGFSGDLVAVFFTSSDRGWIAGDGAFGSDHDGGDTWKQHQLNTTEDINEIYFRNDDNGYLVAGRKMFITRDAGRIWQGPGSIAPVNSVQTHRVPEHSFFGQEAWLCHWVLIADQPR
jgi:hypothetical protein